VYKRQAYPLWAGAVSSLFYAQRLYQFPLGVLGISLATVIYPVMSENAARGDREALVGTITSGIRAAIFIALPATAGLILVSRSLLSVIFERGQFTSSDTAQTSGVLIFYAIGLTGYFCQQLVTRAFYAFQDSKTPARTAMIAVAVNVTLNLILIWVMGVPGLAFSTALCSYLQVIVLIWILKRRFGLSILAGFHVNFLKPIVNTIFMTVVGYLILLFMRALPQTNRFELLRLLTVVGVCSGAYLLGAKALKDDMLSLIIHRRKN
jgi:putative peptidoglycan lipid II flippase